MKNRKDYEEAIATLCSSYNGDEKMALITTPLQPMNIIKSMAESPTQSEVAVVRVFEAKLISLQNQLDPSYHTDHFLRDRIFTAVYITQL